MIRLSRQEEKHLLDLLDALFEKPTLWRIEPNWVILDPKYLRRPIGATGLEEAMFKQYQLTNIMIHDRGLFPPSFASISLPEDIKLSLPGRLRLWRGVRKLRRVGRQATTNHNLRAMLWNLQNIIDKGEAAEPEPVATAPITSNSTGTPSSVAWTSGRTVRERVQDRLLNQLLKGGRLFF